MELSSIRRSPAPDKIFLPATFSPRREAPAAKPLLLSPRRAALRPPLGPRESRLAAARYERPPPPLPPRRDAGDEPQAPTSPRERSASPHIPSLHLSILGGGPGGGEPGSDEPSPLRAQTALRAVSAHVAGLGESPPWWRGRPSSSFTPISLSNASAPPADVLAALRRVRAFRLLSEASLVALAQLGERRTVGKYASVAREGASGSTFLVVVTGALVAPSTRRAAGGAALAGAGGGAGGATGGGGGGGGGGGPVGEQRAVWSCGDGVLVAVEAPREASWQAAEETELLAFRHFELRPFVTECDGALLRELGRAVTLSLLQRLWPFRLAGRGAVEKAAGLFELRSFAQGSCVFRQGEKADAVLFVVAGCVRLWREPCAAAEDRVADVSPSSPAPWLGELGVSARVPRAVTAFAALGTTLAAVRADDLASLLALVPGLQRAFLAAMRTYRQANRKRAEQLARAREGGASAVLAMRTRPLRNWAALCAALLLSAAEGDRQHARRAGAGATLSLALGDYV